MDELPISNRDIAITTKKTLYYRKYVNTLWMDDKTMYRKLNYTHASVVEMNLQLDKASYYEEWE